MSQHSFEHTVRIESDHPALPGHFPSQPLVPGVVLLEQVAVALRAWRGQRLARVVEAKFTAPLLPGQSALLRLSEAASVAPAGRIRFELHRDGELLARGVIEGVP